MIGLHLPTGTKIECIFETRPENLIFFHGLHLRKGAIYTLDGYSPKGPVSSVWIVEEAGAHPGSGIRYQYPRTCFNVVQLPELPTSILECLNVRRPSKREREDA